MRQLLSKTLIFCHMIKLEHSLFALPFAYLGLFLGADGWPGGAVFFWVTLAMVSFRTLGMGLNRLIDKAIDAANPRTQGRALPAGRLKNSFVITASVVSFFIFECSAYQLNSLCFQLSWAPVLLAILYPWLKRFTWFSHFVLGLILGIAPYGAWLASQPFFSWIPGLLTLGVTAWVAGFDIIYALQDEAFDRQTGLFSFPVRFGVEKSLILTRCLHGVALMAWFAAGAMAGLGSVFVVGVILVAFLLIRENWLIKTRGLAKVQEAFFTMNAMVSFALFAFVLADLALRGGMR